MCEPASLCSLHLGKRYCLQLLTEKIQVMLVILFIQLSALSDDSTTCKCADCWKCQRRSEETKGFDPKWVIASAASGQERDLGTKETGHPDRFHSFHLYTSEVKKEGNVLFVLVSDIFYVIQKRVTWRVSCGVSAASCDWVCESFNMSVYLWLNNRSRCLL